MTRDESKRTSTLFLEVADCAEILGTTPKFVRQNLQRGRIPGIKIGGIWRVNRAEFMKRFGITGEMMASVEAMA